MKNKGIEMTINHTLNYLLAKQAPVVLGFSAQLTTVSAYLKCPGGEAGDGMPLPRKARVYRIDCWDGVQITNSIGNIVISQGDRISVYALANGGTFDVYLRVNGSNSTLFAAGVNQNVTVYVSIYATLI